MTLVVANGITHHVQRLSAQGYDRAERYDWAEGYDRAGGGPAPTVVLVHGLLADSLASYYFTLGPAFAAAGFDVVMYDLRGHGRTTRPGTGYRLADFLDDLDALLVALRLPTPLHLVGNSFGGTLVFSYAERRPERVSSVVLVESTPATARWATEIATTLTRCRHQLPKPEVMAGIAEDHGRRMARMAKAAVRLLDGSSLAEELPNSEVLPAARVAAVTVPVMAVYGARSDMVVRERRLESLLPSCDTVVVPGQGHWVLVNRPTLVGDLILDWLRRGQAR